MLTILPPPRCAHHGHDRPAGEEHRRDVDVHHLAPLVERDLLERAHLERGVEAGVVDEDVDRAAALDDLVDQPLHVGLVRDVGGDADAVRERRGRLLGAVQVGDDDARALRRQALGDRAADALRRAGDDRDLAVEAAISGSARTTSGSGCGSAACAAAAAAAPGSPSSARRPAGFARRSSRSA